MRLLCGGNPRLEVSTRRHTQRGCATPGLTANFLLVSAQSDELFHSTNVEYLDCLISRSRRDEVAVRTPLAGLYRVLVAVSAAKKCHDGSTSVNSFTHNVVST